MDHIHIPYRAGTYYIMAKIKPRPTIHCVEFEDGTRGVVSFETVDTLKTYRNADPTRAEFEEHTALSWFELKAIVERSGNPTSFHVGADGEMRIVCWK